MRIRLSIALAALTASAFTLNAFASEFGRIKGQFAVSPTGAATYQIPIWVPPGPRGIQPNLSLVYNSQSGDGILGPGWQIAELSSITRCNLTVAQDAAPAPITLTYSDRFCLDGQRLRLTSSETLSTYGEAGTTYQTEVANFSNVTATGATGNGPSYFTVQAKNGLTYEYGNVNTVGAPSNGSQVLLGSTVSQWLLDKVSDRNGNNYVITYTAPNGATGVGLPTTLSYTPQSSGSTTYNYTVTFSYEKRTTQNSGTNDPAISGYIGAENVLNPNLLTGITVKSTGTTVRQYSFGYSGSPTTTRALLTSVTECGGSAGTDCLLPTNITYQAGSAGVATAATTAVSGDLTVIAARDFNGDGRDDILYLNGTTLYVAFATATGFSTPVEVAAYSGNTAEISFGDLLGKGQSDILIPVSNIWWRYTYNGSAFTGASTGIALDANVNYAVLIDVNGDGRADLVTAVLEGQMHIYARLNASSGSTFAFASTETLTLAPTCTPLGQNYSCLQTIDANGGLRSKLHGLDFNGDGMQDLMVHQANYFDHNYTSTTNYLMLSNGSTFAANLWLGSAAPFVFLNANND